MFIVRGVSVSLACFFLVYCALSLLIAGTWRYALRLRMPARNLARLLFALRVAPLAVSALITLFVMVPSFWRLEPRGIDEDLGVVPLLLGICCVTLFGYGLHRVLRAQSRTARAISYWLEGANRLELSVSTPAFRAHRNIPPLTLAGVCKPKVLVAESTMELLSHEELRVAIDHEVAHSNSFDNLKKLTFCFSPAIGMSELERAWQDAAEMAADDAAVHSLQEALDLAAALIKLSRLVPVEAAPAISMALVYGSVSTRVSRLLNWKETGSPRGNRAWWATIPGTIVLLIGIAAAYGPLLTGTHQLTEWLVR